MRNIQTLLVLALTGFIHLLVAGGALADAGATPQGLNQAINDLRKGRTADSAGAEEGYDALKKYAQDLTAAALNAAIQNAQSQVQAELQRASAGMALPGAFGGGTG